MAKIRAGFVANSSSSSYVLIVKNDRFTEVTSTLHPSHRRIVEMVVESKMVLGESCAVFHDLEIRGEGLSSRICLPEDIEVPYGGEKCDLAWSAFYEYKKAVKEILAEQDYFETSLYQG